MWSDLWGDQGEDIDDLYSEEGVRKKKDRELWSFRAWETLKHGFVTLCLEVFDEFASLCRLAASARVRNVVKGCGNAGGESVIFLSTPSRRINAPRFVTILTAERCCQGGSRVVRHYADVVAHHM